MSGYPVQYAKVQPPPLREETLARHRLLDWLAQKIHQRIVLVLADAGYGKTTLLADFANRTRLRTLWYRLDEDDRDWISLLAHLVAAGREADPAFAPKTAALLADTSLSGPTRDTVIEVFIGELQAVAPQGAILIFDDFHLVDDAPDAQLIARELVAHAPERLSIVFASRRPPGIPMAKLRATGEVAELTTDDLRFDAVETEQLFRETYGRTLEPDVLADVAARTEGWAASLQLVHAALRDRTPGEIRGFVRGLTGADHDLYDYLAEEVVGDLPADMQAFLMRTSILQVVTPEFAEVVAGVDATSSARLTAAAERATLLGRRARGPRDELRYHPLVRTFLEDRFARECGVGAVRELHRVVAAYAQDRDWRIAAHHLWAADDRSEALDVIDTAAKAIIGRGEYLVAAPFLTDLPAEESRASFEVVLSRRDFKEGDVRRALARAQRAVELDSRSEIGLANLASIFLTLGHVHESNAASRALLAFSTDREWVEIGHEMLALLETANDGSIDGARTRLSLLVERHHKSGHTHFEGISLLNLSEMMRAMGDASEAADAARAAIECLESTGASTEVSSAKTVLAWALVHLGESEPGWSELYEALKSTHSAIHVDVLVEAAHLEALYGDADRAEDHLTEARRNTEFGGLTAHLGPTASYLAIRRGDPAAADALSADVLGMATAYPGYRAYALAVRAHALATVGSSEAAQALDVAVRQAQTQSADRWVSYCEAIEAASGTADDLGRYVRQRSRTGAWPLTYVAELVAARLGLLAASEVQTVAAEATLRPRRWRSALRQVVDEGQETAVAAARLLESIGTSDDVARLRRFAHRYRGRAEADIGRALARSTAAPVFVDDLGRVTITVGMRAIEGTEVRRKVLALLCFLLSRPRSTATRDEVMDALWPDYDPGDALNSLNQTLYFLRRVFEPNFKDDLSPGYIRHESDVIWLDEELIRSQGRICRDLIQSMGHEPSPLEVARLANLYHGVFALDFAYEEWAGDYRTSLHSSYLQVMERAVALDTSTGHFSRGIEVARRALSLAPEADEIELSLLRLYRLSGSHSAAAEQYEHYAATIRENLGIEPPAFESL